MRESLNALLLTALLAVIQGWDVTEAQVEAQISAAKRAGVTKVIVARTRIEQGWQPRIVKKPR